MTKTKTVTKTPLTMADLTAAEYRRAAAAYHEAGHLVVASVLGAQPKAMLTFDIRPDTPVLGSTRMFGIPAEAEPMATLAGPLAEARFRFGAKPSTAELHAVLEDAGRCDHADLNLSLAASAGSMMPRQQTERILDRCWFAVGPLASKLYRDGEAGHQDVCRALGLPEVDDLRTTTGLSWLLAV